MSNRDFADFAKSEKETRSAINAVFSYIPIISELHTGYVLADSIFENLDLIQQLYTSYEKKGLVGVVSTIVSDNIQNAMASLRTNIVWSAICKFIPPPVQNESKEILSEVMSNVTSAEINFVRRFIEKQKVKTANNWTNQPERSDFSRSFSTSNKMPGSTDYV